MPEAGIEPAQSSAGAGTSGKKARRVFATQAAGKAWGATRLNDLARGRVLAITRMTLRQAAEGLLTGMRDGQRASAPLCSQKTRRRTLSGQALALDARRLERPR